VAHYTKTVLPARGQSVPAIERFFQFSLLGLVTCAFCALADTGRLDLPSLSFLLAGVFWRGLMVLGIAQLRIPQRLVTFLAIGYIFFFYPIDFRYISHDFFAATAHGVCFLGVVRILSAQSNRDYLYTGSLAFVALMGAAALSTQIRFFLWMALAILFGLGVMTSAEIRRGFQRNARAAPVAGTRSRRTVWTLGLLVASAGCGILALTAGLFFLIPRTARAAAMLLPNSPRLSGFANSIDLGRLGAMAKDDRPVLHVHSLGKTLPPDMKWRGSALSHFTGVRWDQPPVNDQIAQAQGLVTVADRAQLARLDGERVTYRVDVASSDTGALFIAGIPEYITVEAPTLARTPEDSFLALPAMGEPLGYSVSAQFETPLPYPLSDSERKRDVELPPRLDRRIAGLGREWAGAEVSDMARAQRIQAHLHRDFVYSLDVGNSPVRDPLANFLFVTRRGYCEYFASAMAVMLRTQAIPARVVTGFQSGYYNDVSGSWVMRASDAHAWVEAWIDGQGWVTFDPTPPGAAQAEGGWLESKMRRMGMYLDAADTAWQQWVLAYNPGQQAALAFSFRNKLLTLGDGGSGFAWPKRLMPGLPWWLIAAAAGAVVLLVRVRRRRLWNLWNARRRMAKIRRGEGTANDARVLYERMLDSMAKRGFQKPAWFTPVEFARNLPAEERERIGSFTAAYNEVRFGGDPAGAARLAQMLESITGLR
jgi:transglutaminase-like putative cysteine protease